MVSGVVSANPALKIPVSSIKKVLSIDGSIVLDIIFSDQAEVTVNASGGSQDRESGNSTSTVDQTCASVRVKDLKRSSGTDVDGNYFYFNYSPYLVIAHWLMHKIWLLHTFFGKIFI